MKDAGHDVASSFSVGASIWVRLRDLAAVVVLVLVAVCVCWLAITWGIVWLGLVAIVPLLFAGGLGFSLWHRPLAFTFDTEMITITRCSGRQRFRSAWLDEIVDIPGGSHPRLILWFSDGQRLAISQDQAGVIVAELRQQIEQLITPLKAASPWQRAQNRRLSPQEFGPGSTRPFSYYLQRQSTVTVSSVEDVVGWLKGCEFVFDEVQFGKDDVWQHPAEFEKSRKGDCEDHALWAWRKLAELDLESELVVGNSNGLPHAWVSFVREGEIRIMETTTKEGELIFPAHQVREKYQPRCGVNGHLVTYSYSAGGQPPPAPDSAGLDETGT